MTSRAESCPPKLVLRNTTLGKPNAALQGAAQAFSARLANISPPTKPLSTLHGAAAAAAAAAGTRSFVKNGPVPRPIEQQDARQPVPIKSPSQSAARAASARASPQKDVVFEKGSSEPTAMYPLTDSPEPIGDPIRQRKTEVEEGNGTGRPYLDNSIAIPQPVRPLPASAAISAILGLEPEISPRSTPHSASPSAATPNNSAGMSAARAAAKRAAPAMQWSDHSSKAIVDTPSQSSASPDSLPFSRDGVQSSLELETAFPTSSTHGPKTQFGQPGSENMQKANASIGHESESAASSAMKRRTSSNEILQSASKSPPKNAIAADAMIAWSVASSRAASPAKAVPPPTLRRRSKSFGMFHHRQKSSEHESSKQHVPTHVLKHTLRKHHQADEDDEENEIVKRGRRHFIRKHQHKHHEGDRKRWRDRVTDRERKRYEGVWAANRGLFTFWDFSTTALENPSGPPAEMDAVLNIVVREVWERSRLPRSELEEVWDLVARENAKTLRRDEFVVGMWLLDQCLKGRKLPTRVSPSVWASVRHTLKIRAKP
jgi:hypothetical protein